MKKCLLFLFLLSTLTILAQTKEPITGFWGLSFGDSKYKVKEKLKEYYIKDIDDRIFIENLIFDGIEYDICSVEFLNNKMFEGVFCKKNTYQEQAITFIIDLKLQLDNKYGLADIENSDNYIFYAWTEGKSRILLSFDTRDNTIYLIYSLMSLKKVKEHQN